MCMFMCTHAYVCILAYEIFCWCFRRFLRKLICRTAEPHYRGQACTHRPLLPCLITWRAKHPVGKCVKIQYLLLQFAALTSCKANLICPQISGLVPDSRLSLQGLGSFHSGTYCVEEGWVRNVRFLLVLFSQAWQHWQKKGLISFLIQKRGKKSWLKKNSFLL